MARPASVHPTDGELEILNILWSEGATSLSVLCEQLRRQRDVATTTVATMLRVMLDKRLVRRKGAGRGAVWVAVVTHRTAAQGMVTKLVEGLFDGSANRLAMHLVEGDQLTEKQIAELRKLIDERSAQSPRATRVKKARVKKGARK